MSETLIKDGVSMPQAPSLLDGRSNWQPPSDISSESRVEVWMIGWIPQLKDTDERVSRKGSGKRSASVTASAPDCKRGSFE